MVDEQRTTAAGWTADALTTLLQSLVPASIWHAEARGFDNLRALLECHQDTIAPISQAFAFGLPNAAALGRITHHAAGGIIVEVGAGNGLWAALLRKCGLRVIASDANRPTNAFCVIQVESGASAVAHAGPAAALLLCWPPLELEVATSDGGGEDGNLMALEALTAFRGRILFYVGEWRHRAGFVATLSWRTAMHGHTAGARFQAMVEADFELVEIVPIPRWPGFADALYVFRRNESRGVAATAGVIGGTPLVNLPATPPLPLHSRLSLMVGAGLTQRAALAAAILLDATLCQAAVGPSATSTISPAPLKAPHQPVPSTATSAGTPVPLQPVSSLVERGMKRPFV